jgi:hypothetical protein
MNSKRLLSAPPGVNGTSRPIRLFLGRKRPRSTKLDTLHYLNQLGTCRLELGVSFENTLLLGD